jgi:hypothetical protein
MLPLGTLALIAWSLWRGGSALGTAALAAGLAVQLALALRYAGSIAPAGGHAEWVRERSARRRLRRHPLWLVALGLVALGVGLTAAGSAPPTYSVRCFTSRRWWMPAAARQASTASSALDAAPTGRKPAGSSRFVPTAK